MRLEEKMKFPYEVKNIEGDEDVLVKSVFKNLRNGLIKIDNKWVMADSYRPHAETIYNMEVRPDDIWIVTYPKSGTTITQELVWQLMNNLNFEKSKEVPLFERSRFIEHTAYYNDDLITELAEEYPNDADLILEMKLPRYNIAKNDPSPRIIKTHAPFSLLPPNLEDKCKVVYVARNPKDVSVSYYHHSTTSKSFSFCGDYSQYLNCFINDLIISGPFWDHVQEGWEKKNHPNVLFIFYEDLVKDAVSTVKKVANFLGKELKDEEIESLVNHLKIDNFRENVKIRNDREFKAFQYRNPKTAFIRKGGVGKNNEITEEVNRILDTWIEKEQVGRNIPFQMK